MTDEKDEALSSGRPGDIQRGTARAGRLPGRDAALRQFRSFERAQHLLEHCARVGDIDPSISRSPETRPTTRGPAFYPCSGRPKVSAGVHTADFTGLEAQNLGSSRPFRGPTPTRDVQGQITGLDIGATPLLGETQLKCRLTTIGSERDDSERLAHRDFSLESRSTAYTQATICLLHRLSGVGHRKTRPRVRKRAHCVSKNPRSGIFRRPP